MGRGRRQSNAWAPSSCGNKSPPTRRLETTHRCYLAILEVEAHLVSLGLNHPWARLSSLPDARSPRLVGPFPPPHACSHPASPSCPGPSSPSWQDRCEYIGHQNDPGQAPHRPSLHRQSHPQSPFTTWDDDIVAVLGIRASTVPGATLPLGMGRPHRGVDIFSGPAGHPAPTKATTAPAAFTGA